MASLKSCEECRRGRVDGERFCWVHRYRLLKKMKQEGYLTYVPKVKWSDEPRILLSEDNVAQFQASVVRIW